MLILDVEASGTEYQKHSIVSIGAVDFENPANRFYGECKIWASGHVMDGALEVSQLPLRPITVESKKTEAELLTEFIEWTQHMSDRPLTGQNVSFDRDFVKAALERAGQPYDLAYRTLDTHTMCWMHIINRGEKPPIDEQHRRSALNLDAVLNYCGIPEEPQPHNALTGALSHAEVTSRLLYGRKLLPEFEQFDIP